MNRFILLTISMLVLAQLCLAQDKYWVFFRNRPTSPSHPNVSSQALSRRVAQGLPAIQSSDFAPDNSYLKSIGVMEGVRVGVVSKWLNAVSIQAPPKNLQAVSALPFVEEIRPIRHHAIAAYKAPKTSDSLNLTIALEQLGAKAFNAKNLDGKGITIGLIDAGFAGADRSVNLRHLFAGKQILAARDFERPSHTATFYSSPNPEVDDHGAEVLGYIAGIDPENGKHYGAAPKARFVLCRTDNFIKEYRQEEDLWVAAMEYCDSIGVHVINSSLGYALNFDNPKENHATLELDGKTTVVAKAVSIAAKEKGIAVIVSAGNEGADASWVVLATPADSPDCLAVGANQSRVPSKMSYSSEGVSGLPFVKPDVSAYSLLGTSFASPLIAGFVACLVQARPSAKPTEIYQTVRQAGHLAASPNTYLGYGVPDASRAITLLEGGRTGLPATRISSTDQTVTLEVDKPFTSGTELVVFHKKDSKTVVSQEIKLVAFNGITITRPTGEVKFSTVSTIKELVEIEWK